MGPVATERLEVFVSSEMGTSRWRSLRRAAGRMVAKIGHTPLLFEDLPPGPIESNYTVTSLGPEWARRADLVVAVIGSAISDPVAAELEAAWNRDPRPPIAFLFDTTTSPDADVRELREGVGDQAVLGDFRTTAELSAKVGAFLTAHAEEARRRLRLPRVLLSETLSLDPGAEARRKLPISERDHFVVTAEATDPRHKFHFAVVDRARFVELTQNLPWTAFPVGSDKYSFRSEVRATEADVYHIILRRPWWFHVEPSKVDLSVRLIGRAL